MKDVLAYFVLGTHLILFRAACHLDKFLPKWYPI